MVNGFLIILQPDKRLAIFSSDWNDFVLLNTLDDNVVEFVLGRLSHAAARQSIESARRDVAFTGWKTCIETIQREHGTRRVSMRSKAIKSRDYDLICDLP